MENVHPLLFLPPLTWAFVCCGMTAVIYHLDSTLRRLNGELTSKEDMALLRRALHLNIRCALFVPVLGTAYAVLSVGLYAVGMISLVQMAVYLFGFAISCAACASLYARPVEQRARRLRVTSDDLWVSRTYCRWMEQWGKVFYSVS